MGEATLMQGWNLSGLPGDRRASLRAEGDQLSSEARAAALSHKLGAAQSWIEAWAAQQSLADSVQEYELAREFSEKMARAAEAAAFTRAEAADAATYAAEAHVLAIAAEGEVVDRGYQLAVAMGQQAEKPLVAAGPLPAPPSPGRVDWPALLEAAGKLPAVAARKLAADADRAREAEFRSMKGWGLGTGVKGTRDYLGTWGAQAVLEVSFPLFDRGEREAAPAAAAAARAQGDYQEARAIAATELARSLHEVRAHRRGPRRRREGAASRPRGSTPRPAMPRCAPARPPSSRSSSPAGSGPRRARSTPRRSPLTPGPG